MQTLDEKYYQRLGEIAAEIQGSPELAQYLEEEEESYYNEMRRLHEQDLSELHHLVASEAPLQLPLLEQYMLNENFEGLYLPRVLGYAVLRGEVSDQYRYVRPNDHFKEILLAICQSPHFELLRKRIGQTIQVGFALSSDIWITNLLSRIDNKRIRYFLQQQKNERFWDINERADIYRRYANQFRNELYFSADFPQSLGEMKANFSALRQFMIKRFELGRDNSSLKTQIREFLDRAEFFGTEEYMEMLAMTGNFIEMDEAEQQNFKAHFERERKNLPEFDELFLQFLLSLYRAPLQMDATQDTRMHALIQRSVLDRISDYYQIAEKVHSLGYVHPDIMETVREFCNAHEGLSVEIACLRELILNYFKRLAAGLTEREYGDYFELTKIFNLYMQIFGNEQFNLEVERLSMNYVDALLKTYTDKRGKDYQDIKRFVSTQFVDMHFLKEKEVAELFKTRRKKRSTAEE